MLISFRSMIDLMANLIMLSPVLISDVDLMIFSCLCLG